MQAVHVLCEHKKLFHKIAVKKSGTCIYFDGASKTDENGRSSEWPNVCEKSSIEYLLLCLYEHVVRGFRIEAVSYFVSGYVLASYYFTHKKNLKILLHRVVMTFQWKDGITLNCYIACDFISFFFLINHLYSYRVYEKISQYKS